MCEAYGEEDGEQVPVKLIRDKSNNREQKCVKCNESGVLKIRLNDSFCKNCFQVYIVHKFRASIGKAKVIRSGEHVVVAFSGGINSAALLHLIQDGKSERAHKKLRFIPSLVYVDETSLLDVSDEERQTVRSSVTKLMLDSGFPTYITNLEQVLEFEKQQSTLDSMWQVHPSDGCSNIPMPTQSQSGRLKALITGLGSLSSAEDFIRNLRNQLLAAAARKLGVTKVLTAESATRLAVRILSDVAQGRGSQVSLNTGFSDERNGDVMFIRPVRDLNAKELAMYNSLFHVDSVFIPTITTKTDPGSSIERLTETFVMGLQEEFPSTVSNIKRTSEKLDLPDVKDSIKCCLCQSPLDTDVGLASALNAIELSKQLSKSSGRTPVDGADVITLSEPFQDLKKLLCYGCSLGLSQFKGDLSTLPPFVMCTSKETKTQECLREKISSFLLTDETE
ncbi:cytoplasmic tRNA 2-thiolation protein 2-like [Physella acuta]|uniref:cytoplasmic tRNA 2-thiolation protein 2-like n=1 Tax=Physella acuta TaxID=109671 RepID=UPI0027DCE7BF|nr:cytoplasmic tRNA 2-thiolation protein 2-like [Physella acuta]XP_059172756.1 cytoplasmic tRNA 2-thiolation protein 2-like [Physella acuta]XP_059172757.1 cytoplasmic tRNA 2-thiolation protein 2-like [Physella acuta]